MKLVTSFIDKWVERTECTFVSELWGWVKKTVTEVVNVVERVVEYAVTFGKAIYDNI